MTTDHIARESKPMTTSDTQEAGKGMHTPTPWGLAKDGQHNHLVHVVARSGEDWIADCDCLNGLSRDECEANAQFIVTAVNSHSTLTEENARLKDRVRELVTLLDNQLGTPCEQIRHAEENARLLQENKAMREALKPFAKILETKFYDVRWNDSDKLAVLYDGNDVTVGDPRRAFTILTQG